MYAQAAIKLNILLRNGAYGIVMRGVHFCTCAGVSLRSRNSVPLCCIIYMTATDPCMGSGHILVYAFDVLMEIYREAGYTDRDAATSILENNLFGMDIDQRAYQLAYFAVMMKARSYNRRIFSKGVKCNVAVINESNGISKFTQANVTLDRKQNEIGEYLIDVFRHAKEIGSLQTVEAHDYDAFA